MDELATKKEPRERAERKLQRARQRFEATQEQYLLIREQGKQRVEKAQLQADRKLTKIHEQLQKRAQSLMRAEERLLALDVDEALAAGGSILLESTEFVQQVQLEHVEEATGT